MSFLEQPTSEHDERLFRRVTRAKDTVREAWRLTDLALKKAKLIKNDREATKDEKDRAGKLIAELKKAAITLHELFEGSPTKKRGLYHEHKDLESYMKRRKAHPEDFPDSDDDSQ